MRISLQKGNMNRVQNIQVQFDTLKESNEILHINLKNEIQACDNAEKTVKIKNREISDLYKLIYRYEKQLAALNSQNKELQITIKILKQEVIKLEKEKRLAEKYIATLKSKIVEYEEQINKL